MRPLTKAFGIVQYSTARSGSTLCVNAIKALCPKTRVRKVHALRLRYVPLPVIVTLRDPLDSVVSMIRRHNRPINDETVEAYSRELFENGYQTLRLLRFFPFAMVLRYEDFAFDHRYLFDRLSEFLEVTYLPADLEEFSARFDVTKLRVQTAGRSFDELDAETGLHGSHISATLGRNGQGKLLTENQRKIAVRALGLPSTEQHSF